MSKIFGVFTTKKFDKITFHVSHVSTQLPYATTVAIVSAISYVIAGYTSSPVIPLAVGVVLLLGVLFFLRSREGSYKVPDSVNINSAAQ